MEHTPGKPGNMLLNSSYNESMESVTYSWQGLLQEIIGFLSSKALHSASNINPYFISCKVTIYTAYSKSLRSVTQPLEVLDAVFDIML